MCHIKLQPVSREQHVKHANANQSPHAQIDKGTKSKKRVPIKMADIRVECSGSTANATGRNQSCCRFLSQSKIVVVVAQC